LVRLRERIMEINFWTILGVFAVSIIGLVLIAKIGKLL